MNGFRKALKFKLFFSSVTKLVARKCFMSRDFSDNDSNVLPVNQLMYSVPKELYGDAPPERGYLFEAGGM